MGQAQRKTFAGAQKDCALLPVAQPVLKLRHCLSLTGMNSDTKTDPSIRAGRLRPIFAVTDHEGDFRAHFSLNRNGGPGRQATDNHQGAMDGVSLVVNKNRDCSRIRLTTWRPGDGAADLRQA
jgi:hypothetical protein